MEREGCITVAMTVDAILCNVCTRWIYTYVYINEYFFLEIHCYVMFYISKKYNLCFCVPFLLYFVSFIVWYFYHSNPKQHDVFVKGE